MKATIKANGMLVVVPETELEAYALGRWSAANMPDWFDCSAKPTPKFMLDCDEFPGAFDPVVLSSGGGHHE